MKYLISRQSKYQRSAIFYSRCRRAALKTTRGLGLPLN